MLDDDPLEQRRRHPGVPDAFRVDDDDRSACTYTETWRLSALHAARTEEQALALEQACEFRVQHAPFPVRRAVAANAHQDVARERIHDGGELGGRECHG